MCISANFKTLKIKNHVYPNVYLHHFLEELTKKILVREPKDMMQCSTAVSSCFHRPSKFEVEKSAKLTCHRFFDRISSHIPPSSVVVAETGLTCV